MGGRAPGAPPPRSANDHSGAVILWLSWRFVDPVWLFRGCTNLPVLADLPDLAFLCCSLSCIFLYLS